MTKSGSANGTPDLGELIRESVDEVGWNVTDTAARLGCERGTLSRLLNGKAGVSANTALALEDNRHPHRSLPFPRLDVARLSRQRGAPPCNSEPSCLGRMPGGAHQGGRTYLSL